MTDQAVPQLIHINYAELFRAADLVDQRAGSLEQAGRQVMNVCRQVTEPAVWSGLAARAFYTACALFVNVLNGVTRQLSDASGLLRRYGREMQAEEERENAEIRRQMAALGQGLGAR